MLQYISILFFIGAHFLHKFHFLNVCNFFDFQNLGSVFLPVILGDNISCYAILVTVVHDNHGHDFPRSTRPDEHSEIHTYRVHVYLFQIEGGER